MYDVVSVAEKTVFCVLVLSCFSFCVLIIFFNFNDLICEIFDFEE